MPTSPAESCCSALCEYPPRRRRLLSTMGKVSLAVAVLGAFVQWLPIVRGPLALHLSSRGLHHLRKSLTRMVRARLRGACARVALLFILGSFTILLPALAYGSPPDPSW